MPATMKTTLTLLTDIGVLLGTAGTAGAFPDGGAGESHGTAPERLLSPSCTKIVHCKAGDAFTDASFQTKKGTLCVEECGGHCCEGDAACDGGQFSVCADEGDGSCYGKKACNPAGSYGCAGIGLISGGSCKGDGACKYLGGGGWDITSCCIGTLACFALDALPGTCSGPTWPSISLSCAPSTSPSKSGSPSRSPSVSPSAAKSALPSRTPSGFPSAGQSGLPSSLHSASPSTAPSTSPSKLPSTPKPGKGSKSKSGKNSKSKTGKVIHV